MPVGKILAELAENEVPHAESHEIIKMKILSAYKRMDPKRGICDLNDIMALIKQVPRLLRCTLNLLQHIDTTHI